MYLNNNFNDVVVVKELDTAIKAEDHDEIDNEHEQEIQEMIQVNANIKTNPKDVGPSCQCVRRIFDVRK